MLNSENPIKPTIPIKPNRSISLQHSTNPENPKQIGIYSKLSTANTQKDMKGPASLEYVMSMGRSETGSTGVVAVCWSIAERWQIVKQLASTNRRALPLLCKAKLDCSVTTYHTIISVVSVSPCKSPALSSPPNPEHLTFTHKPESPSRASLRDSHQHRSFLWRMFLFVWNPSSPLSQSRLRSTPKGNV